MNRSSTTRRPRPSLALHRLRQLRLQRDRLQHSPFSEALIPLSIGLRRKFMLQQGAREYALGLQGSDLHYYHAPGRGPLPVVLVHGIADNATTWAYMFGALRSIGPVYAIDLPGFGHSSPPPGSDFVSVAGMTELLEHFLAEVVGRPVLLVGNSMGGWMGFRIGLERPELLRGLIAINPGGAPLAGRESWQPFIDMASVPNLEAVRLIYRRMFARPPIRFPLYAGQIGFQRLFSCPAVQRLLTQTSEADFLADEQLCSLELPLGIVWGTADQFLPDGSREFFQSCLAHARWLLLPATGHLPQIERPIQVVGFIRRFAAELGEPHRRPLQPAELLALLLQRALLRRST